jgi:hypothetical protein
MDGSRFHYIALSCNAVHYLSRKTADCVQSAVNYVLSFPQIGRYPACRSMIETTFSPTGRVQYAPQASINARRFSNKSERI